LVWAVVRAIARADTAVIDHVIEPLVVVHGSVDRAHHLAGGVFTVHTEDGLVIDFGLVWRTLVVPVDAQPVHFPAALHFTFAHNGNVIFRLAGQHTGVTPQAGVQIDDHAPGIALIRLGRIERLLRLRVRRYLLRKMGLFQVLLERTGAHQMASLH